MRFRSSRTCQLLVAMASVLVVACSDSTAPVASRIPGMYEFTTALDSFTYPSNCTYTINGLSCLDSSVAAGPSRIYGTFTVGDTIAGTSGAMQFPVSNLSLRQADCAMSTTRCAEDLAIWYDGTFTVKRDSLTLSGEMSGSLFMVLRGRFVDNSFVGTLTWYTYVGCCGSSYYSGTFVATRSP